MAPSPLPRRINVISYNLWLIPFSGAWNFGRVNRCRDRVAFECAKLEREAPSDLQIVALQEAWAFRAGLAYPLLWLMHKFEAFLLGLGLCGGVEPAAWTLVKNATSALAALWAWVPGARRILWCPKWRFVEALGQLGLPWHASGRGAFAAHPNFARPPLLMDSGLLLLGSRAPDACGFEGYSRAESSEALANKGLLWAAFGKLGLVATHMTFQFDDGGASRGRQRAKLANRVAALLGLDADAATPVCDVVIAIAPASFCFRGAARDARAPQVLGDFNHALPEQTTGAGPGEEPEGGSRSTYVRAWLPGNASLDLLLRDLALGGRAAVARLSPDPPTNLDGTVDHVFAVSRRGDAASYAANSMATIADPDADVSDHLMIKCALELQ